MTSNKDLKTLIKVLKDKTGKTQEEISVGAGYGPKTITQLLSKNEGLDGVYNQLQLVYKEELNNSTNDKSVAVLKLKLESKEEVLKAKEQVIEQIEARRKEALAMAEKMERHYQDMKEALERAQNTINDVLKPITEQITANSDQNRDQVLQMIQLLQEQTYIVSTQLEHQRTALGLGYPGQKPEQPAPFVKTGKGSSVPQREDANKGKGG